MAAASGRGRTNTTAHEFELGTNVAAGTYVAFGLYDDAGNWLGGKALSANRTLAVTGDKITFAVGSIDITLPDS